MTDSLFLPGPGRLASATVQDKTEAFRRAARHTRLVRWLRTLVLIGAVLLAAGVVVFALFDPFRAVLPAGVSIDGAGLSGSKVMMARPKMAGYRKDGRPYDFTAESAVQDLKAANVLQLNKLDAHVTMTDGVAHVRADLGVYDTSTETMDLSGDIRVTSAGGYDIRMRSAHIEFKGGNVASTEPVQVALKTGTVSADSMHMTGNGADVSFEGHVRSVILPASAAAPQLKGTTP